MHDRASLTEARLLRYLADRIRPAQYAACEPFTVRAYQAGRPVTAEPETIAAVSRECAAASGAFEPFAIGDAYGPAWSTTWFHLVGTVPAAWRGSTVEARIDLGFGTAPGFQAEGLVWSEGAPVRALNPLNHAIALYAPASGGERVELLVEAAANPMIGGPRYRPTQLGDPATLPTELLYALRRAELSVFDADVNALVHDLEVLGGLIHELPGDAPRRPQITAAIGRALDALGADVAANACAARAELAAVLARPAVPSAHRVVAVGHAHIDTAWMWPLRETVRKCARTFSNVLDLMTREPELRFVCSQAQHHEWMRERYPSIFARMQSAAAAGRFLPVGGMWVEADMNIPSGESLARQMLHGQRFFAQHYGSTCREAWLPDVFGYPASLPQILCLGGAEWFLTQKLSWNKHNRMPSHSFWWEGIDGTRIFTHFPPIDTYNASMTPAELAHAERNFADHGGATMSMAPFGFGDGGGGPTREMMARYRRMRDLEGLPSITIGSPAEFFSRAVEDYPNAPTWVGELYLEMHRGTYTSQVETKQGNRRCEILLGEVELWSTLAAAVCDLTSPTAELAEAWRQVLTLQFHDILPGSSIAWVHDDAEAAHRRTSQAMDALRARALDALAATIGADVLLVNPAPARRREVVTIPRGVVTDVPGGAQVTADGSVAMWVDVPPMSVVAFDADAGADADADAGHGADHRGDGPRPATVDSDGSGAIHLANGVVSVTLDADGLITSFVDHRAGREIVAPGRRANVLELSVDQPVEYDAWDLDELDPANGVALTGADAIDIVDAGPLVVRVRISRSFSSSSITQDIVLRAGSARLDIVSDVSWHEREKVLKVAMPVAVHADRAACGIQFGHVHRPTHASTSWDAAKFEICAQRWVDVSEPGFGVALLDTGIYGHDIQRDALRLTLLRSPGFPDPAADIGEHHFAYALFPHPGGPAEGDVVGEASRLDQPVTAHRRSEAAPATAPGARSRSLTAVASSDPLVVVTAVKAAEDGSGDVIVRCYESSGGRRRTTLTTAFAPAAVTTTDLLERNHPEPSTELTIDGAGAMTVLLRPFQIVTLRLSPPPPAG